MSNILGLSCYYHDSCAVLLRDGKVVAAAQEERFNRDKYSPVFPIQAINYCLQEGGITIYDVDHVAFYEKMYLKFERTVLSHLCGWPMTLRNFLDTMPLWLKDRLAVPFIIREELRFKKPVMFVKHHLSHAASTFLPSGFESAAILTVDGVGEYATASWGVGRGSAIELRQEIHYPHSLGLLYAIFTAYLGFRVFSGEGKVMALAEFGKPEYLDQFRKLVDIRDDGSFRIDTSWFNFNRGETMHDTRLEKLFGAPRREGEALDERHFNIAASLQRITEEVLLKMAVHVYERTKEKKLCMAGGVFLNVTANSRIWEETPFDEVFIQPGAGDAGAALGAAMYLDNTVLGNPRKYVMNHAALGPGYSERQIEVMLRNKRAKYRRLEREEIVRETARRIADNQIIGWFQGRMEFGPRALGNRSILANPANPEMKDKLNLVIKRREPFRPFAASVLVEALHDWFEIPGPSPFMLLVGRVKPDKMGRIPAVTHVNGTSRLQTVSRDDNGIYHELISEVHRLTGLPMVLNTSFNEDEPIVCTPDDAWRCFAETQMDALVLESFFVEK
jgi:carbamoyltransferase